MNNDNELKRQLNRPPVPKDLEVGIRSNWQEQVASNKGHRSIKRYAAVASLCGVMLAVLLINNIHTTTQLVTAAVSDIHNDEKKHLGITVPIDSFSKVANFNLPPKSMTVEMTKYCTLIGNKTMHIKVAGEKQGEVHLFVMRDGFNTSFDQARTGEIESMPWKIIQARNDLSVLVVYSHDMNPQNVEKLIQTMFYA